jgi:hypothetical protein
LVSEQNDVESARSDDDDDDEVAAFRGNVGEKVLTYTGAFQFSIQRHQPGAIIATDRRDQMNLTLISKLFFPSI